MTPTITVEDRRGQKQTTTGLRLIDSPIGPVVPIKDITDQIGYSRSGATRVMQRHEKSFVGLTAVVSIKTPAGTRHVKCLAQKGVEEFIKCLMPDPVAYPELAARVNEFKIKALGIPREPAPALPPSKEESPVVAILTAAADVADVLRDRWKYPDDVARRLAMQDAVDQHPGLLDTIKGPALYPDQGSATAPLALPAPAAELPQRCKECVMAEADPDFDTHFGIDAVAKACGLTRAEALNILEKQGIVAIRMGITHLTRLGEVSKAGKVFTHYPLAPHRMTPKLMIRYSPVAFERIKAELKAKQATLGSRGASSSGSPPVFSSGIPHTTSVDGHCGTAAGGS